MRAPELTVCIPVFNGAEYLGRAIQSLDLHANPWLGVLVVDNCSTDATKEICEAASAEFPNLRLHVAEQHVPALANFNRAARLADSEFLCLLSCDDLLAPAGLRRSYEEARQNPRVGFVGSSVAAVTAEGKAFVMHPNWCRSLTQRSIGRVGVERHELVCRGRFLAGTVVATIGT